MKELLEQIRSQKVMSDLSGLLDSILPDPNLHARLVNTLARMKYVGVRKMLKARRSESLDLAGLHHVLEEASHALRLKRASVALAGNEEEVKTFSEGHTLAGELGEGYLQAVDQACEENLSDTEEPYKTEANYLLSSALIEFRAEAFYPIYEDRLQAHGAPFSVAGIMRDEEKHLQAMVEGLETLLPDWESRVTQILAKETEAFETWVAAIASQIPQPASVN